jgi:sodium transport system permease protein
LAEGTELARLGERPVPIPTWKATLLVAWKELSTSFRDRQTLLYAVVLPLCMYPVLFWVVVQGALLVQGQRERTEVRIGLALAEPHRDTTALEEALERGSQAGDAEGAVPTVTPVEVVRSNLAMSADDARAWLAEPEPKGGLDALLWVPERSWPQERGQILFDSTNSRSRLARKRAGARLELYLEQARSDAAIAAGHLPEELIAFDVQEANVAPQRDMLAYILSFLLPMLLVVMCVMGAFFPAVDLTAGEKERATAETTLLLPVSRQAIQQGKILAVCTSSVLATVLNLLALGLSAGHLLSMLSDEFDLSVTELPLLALVGILPLALLFAFFVSSVLVAVASLAASFKEGQALLGPVQMVFLLPAMAGVLPGLELDMRTACIPVINVVLAFRAMLQHRVLPLEYALTALALLVYALLAIRCAVHVLNREGVALAEQTIPLSRLFGLMRSPKHGS